jgi:Amt family ammonium transporter
VAMPSSRLLFPLAVLCLVPLVGAQAAPDSGINAADTAWMLVATGLVLFMTIPGLALFYGGLVHRRNVLSVLMHCFALTCVMTLLWLFCGYSLSFSGGNAIIGDLKKAFLSDVTAKSESGTIPEVLFFAFQMTFFIITPALIVGTFVERVRFSAVLIFSVLWALVVYAPVCHMVWHENGWFFKMGVIDLAGGIVVHITAGVSALVACIMIGKRRNPSPPHNLPMTVMGTAMLWFGWFGFNGGSGLHADGAAAMSLTVTHISAATAAVAWMAIEWFHLRKPSALGIATGSIAGLAAITPAAGVAGPLGAVLIGLCSGCVCWYFSVKLKNKFHYDDSLDVFGVHGVGGIVGTLLAAVVALPLLQGNAGAGYSAGAQLGKQALASVVVAAYSVVATFVLLKLTGALVGLRVNPSEELEGLDTASHGETAYND